MANKRTFHLLAYDTSRSGLEGVCKYDVDEFDTGIFRECRRFEGPLPPSVRLWVSRGAPTDSLANALGWPVFSDRLIGLIGDFAARDIQPIEVPIFYVDSQEHVLGYRLVNILRSLSAVDLSASVTSNMTVLGKDILNVMKFAFRHDAIPEDIHIFRPKESPSRIVISDELAQAMVGKIVGVAFIRTQTV